MKKSDITFGTALLLLAVFIWFRDTTWMSSADDTLPILVTLPLFFWLGMPWQLSSVTPNYQISKFYIAGFLFLLGIILNSTLILAITWSLLLWTWISARVSKDTLPMLRKLLILPLLAFPWISLDFDRIGWWFRLSGTWVTGHLFQLFGYEVEQEGTLLFIEGFPISIEKACAGLNTLQSMLIAGTLLDFIILGSTTKYWYNLLLLPFIGWLANTFRIIVITASAIFISPQFAMGSFHVVGGWLVIITMFLLCWLIFSWQEPKLVEKL
jgi:exosortase/archaeosortase family protein